MWKSNFLTGLSLVISVENLIVTIDHAASLLSHFTQIPSRNLKSS